MLFSDPKFFAFFAVYMALHFLVPPRFRLYLIIVGSAVFYAAWRPVYLAMPVALAVAAWVGVAWIEAAKNGAMRPFRLSLVLAVVLLPLLVVKYSYFVVTDVVGPFADLSRHFDVESLKWPLPLGISFVTFTLIAYVVDVYRRQHHRESLATVLGYVLFFPHLIAGPILRPHELMPQLKKVGRALDARFTLGITIFTLGLVKKLVFADQIAIVVDRIYATPGGHNTWDYLLAIYGFSVQIYCDFSGYTDMAIGLAYMLRVRLPTNFLRPYSAGSIIDFWRRWHISLSHWLRDYLYIPLGGNRGGEASRLRNILITMVLGGIWHGANWTFVIWGLLHGVGLGSVHLLRRFLSARAVQVPSWLAVLATFHFVTFAWIYFRAPSLADAHRVIGGLLSPSWSDGPATLQRHAFELILIGLFLLLHRYDRHALLRLTVKRINPNILWPVLGTCWILAMTVSQGSSAKFIYFDF